MRISDLIKMGLMNLWRRKGRTVLTVLGVIVGSVSVVLMVSIALGTERANMKMVESFGNIRVVNVRGGYTDYYKYYQDEENSNSAKPKGDDAKKLNEKTIADFQNMEHVDTVMPFYEFQMMLKSGRMENNTSVIACDFDKLKTMGYELGRGRVPEKGEKAMVVFSWLSKDFYDPHSKSDRWEESDVKVFGETLNAFFLDERGKKDMKKSPLRIEAVGESKENSEYGYQVLMDMEAFKEIRLKDIRKYGNYNIFRRDKDKDLYSGVKVLVDSTDNVLAVSEAIKAMGFEANNNAEFMEEMKEQSSIMTLVLGGIGAVALFVAAIGIANTMVMAIYERTREIGVMKVLGAEVFDILKLFLLEAALIGLIGGAVGLGLSYIGSNIINQATAGSMPEGMELSYIPSWLSLSSVIFSTLIGVVSGTVPAIRATRLSALEAIKTQG